MSRRDASLPPPPPPGCRECGSRRDVQVYPARDVGTRPNAPEFGLRLCGRCLRDRGAAWRWRWTIAGRALPEQEDRAA